ncbi:MAG: hypothetical protein J6J15_03985 [Oscillospiraceae bacterium]|nr:hypothetical protein [Oscillospiraceae bacterium]
MSFIVSHFNEPGKALESYVAVGGEGSMMAVNALWDTGSTESLISEKIVKMIEPILKSKAKYVTRDVVIECETYAVSLSLSDEITFRDVLMKKADLSDKNVDIIIGMDIISRGDFEIRNYNNLVEFAFRIPPKNEPITP